MTIPVNPAKVMQLFSPLWALLAISLWLHGQAWSSHLLMFAVIALLPVVAAAAAGLARDHWRLELTQDALVHRTIGRSTRYEWARMGPIILKPSPLPAILFVRTFWFAFPNDAASGVAEHANKLLGVRILCVFGDRAPKDTIKQIEAWRALHAG